MVVKLEGEINGDKVIFQYKSGDLWECTVPASLNGVYIVVLTAYDDSGNFSGIIKYLLAYDPVNLRAKLIPYKWKTILFCSNYCSRIFCSDYCTFILSGG